MGRPDRTPFRSTYCGAVVRDPAALGTALLAFVAPASAHVSITSTAVVIPAAGRMEIQVSLRRSKFENLVPTLTFRIFQHLTTPVIIAHVMQPSVAPV